MSDRYKNEPFNTLEQKAYEKALNKIKELETKIVELRKYSRHQLNCNIYNVYKTEDGCDCGYRKAIDEMRGKDE